MNTCHEDRHGRARPGTTTSKQGGLWSLLTSLCLRHNEVLVITYLPFRGLVMLVDQIMWVRYLASVDHWHNSSSLTIMITFRIWERELS